MISRGFVFIHFILGVTVLTALVACQSKFEESSASGLQQDESAKKEYSLKVQASRQRITQAQDVIHGLNQIMTRFKIQSGEQVLVSDLMEQILDSVNSNQAQKTDKGYVTDGKVYINMPGVAQDCRTIESRSSYLETKEKIHHEISIRTCKTQGEYRKIFEIEMANDKIVSVIPVKDIEASLPDVEINELMAAQGCEVEKDEKVIKKIKCKAGDWILNERELVRFSKLEYQAKRNFETGPDGLPARSTIFTAQGQLLKDGVAQKNLSLELDSAGKTTLKAEDIP